MFGLAMGEWFFAAARLRRIVLLLIAIRPSPLCTNLIRTLVLSLQAEMERASAPSKKIQRFLPCTLAVSALVFSIWIFWARALRQHSDRF